MKNEQPLHNLNQQLKDYVHQMQSEIGRSGRTLHQVFAEYLALKAQNQNLAQEMEGFEIAHVDQLTLEQFQENNDILQRLQILRDKVLPDSMSPELHPWNPFAHPDHRLDDFDLLIRTIRFVGIQLSKFWVEVQSFPLFLKTLENISVPEIEEIFQWLKSSPPWNEIIQQPRIIPALIQPESRESLFEFARDVKCARALCEKAASYQNSTYLASDRIPTHFALLAESVVLTQKQELDLSQQSDLDLQISHYQKQLDQIHQAQRFFTDLTTQTGLPQASQPEEAKKVFQASAYISSMPKKILPWRQPQILAPSQLIRIQALQDRARPILETREKLKMHFKLEEPIQIEELRQLGTALTSGGVLRRFKAPYQDAIQRYKNILQPHTLTQGGLQETGFQMAERLIEWATYLEQVQAFDKNNDVRKTFGPFFKGIDTDFQTALETNKWASELRTALTLDGSTFSKLLIEFLFKSSEDHLNLFVSYLKSSEANVLENILNHSNINSDSNYAKLELEFHQKVTELSRLSDILTQLGFRRELPLSSLKELHQTYEEIIFLMNQIESRPDIKDWLKSHFKGIDTDLSLIKNSAAFVQYMERSSILSSMKTSFLSPQGPQRFGETRTLAISALGSLEALKDLFQKLEVITHGQSKGISDGAIPKLLGSIQQALKQPALLNDWIEYLKSERESKVSGLGPFLDFFEAQMLPGRPLVTAYRLAFHASLLKKVLEHSAQPKEADPKIPIFH